MEIINGINVIPDGVAVALGTFDGIHIGHKKLVENVVNYAKNNGCKSCVYTFDMIPSGAMRIVNNSCRNEILEKIGVDYLYVQHFDPKFKNMTAEDFMSRFLLNAKYISVGFNFRFGSGRQGDTEMLREFCKNNHIEIDVVEPVMYDGDTVSSTRIRKCIELADFDSAQKMLGRYFSVEGVVQHGNEIGRTIGFPTANINVEKEMVMPPEGVYVTVTDIDGCAYKSFTNYGGKPTFFNECNVLLETNVFDFEGDLYGKSIKVYFLDKIRDIEKFVSADVLKEQLLADKNKSLDFFSKNGLQMKNFVV